MADESEPQSSPSEPKPQDEPKPEAEPLVWPDPGDYETRGRDPEAERFVRKPDDVRTKQPDDVRTKEAESEQT